MWAAVESIALEIGRVTQMLLERLEYVEVDTGVRERRDRCTGSSRQITRARSQIMRLANTFFARTEFNRGLKC